MVEEAEKYSHLEIKAVKGGKTCNFPKHFQFKLFVIRIVVNVMFMKIK